MVRPCPTSHIASGAVCPLTRPPYTWMLPHLAQNPHISQHVLGAYVWQHPGEFPWHHSSTGVEDVAYAGQWLSHWNEAHSILHIPNLQTCTLDHPTSHPPSKSKAIENHDDQNEDRSSYQGVVAILPSYVRCVELLAIHHMMPPLPYGWRHSPQSSNKNSQGKLAWAKLDTSSWLILIPF